MVIYDTLWVNVQGANEVDAYKASDGNGVLGQQRHAERMLDAKPKVVLSVR
jgi:hypothetical protein